MTYTFKAERKGNYLYARGEGTLTPANARQFLLDAYKACVASSLESLLLEMGFTGNLGIGAIFEVIADRSADGAKLARIAYVDASTGLELEASEFAETLAQKRGVNVQLFQTLAEAEAWMRAEASGHSTTTAS